MKNEANENTEQWQIEKGLLPWYLSGILVGAVLIVPVVKLMIDPLLSPAVAWIEEIIVAVAVILLINRNGRFLYLRLILALLFAFTCEYIFNSILGFHIYIYGFAIYAIFGVFGLWLGETIRKLQAKKTSE